MMMRPHVVLFLTSLLLSGCAAQEAEIAARGHQELVGLSQADLLMCAGHPNNQDHTPRGDIWMYEHGLATTSVTVTPTIPLTGVSIAPPSGYCRVQLRVVHQKVVEVSYAGATDLFGAEDAICAPIIRNCLDYRRVRGN
jgi:hypothetical protein